MNVSRSIVLLQPAAMYACMAPAAMAKYGQFKQFFD